MDAATIAPSWSIATASCSAVITRCTCRARSSRGKVRATSSSRNAISTMAISVAKAGEEDGSGLIGGSCIVDPNGRIVAQAATLTDEVIVADIDLDLCRQGKDKMFNFAAHRRPEQYRVITERAGVIEP